MQFFTPIQYKDKWILTQYLNQSAADLDRVYEEVKNLDEKVSDSDMELALRRVVEAANTFILKGLSDLSDQRFFDRSDEFEVELDQSEDCFVLRAKPMLSKALNQVGVKNFGYIYKKTGE